MKVSAKQITIIIISVVILCFVMFLLKIHVFMRFFL